MGNKEPDSHVKQQVESLALKLLGLVKSEQKHTQEPEMLYMFGQERC